jgi:DNA helicase HerA-like ATPase
MLKNYAMERLKSVEASELFKRMGRPIPAVIQGKLPLGFIDLYQRFSWLTKGTRTLPPNINDFLQHHSASFGITRSGKSNGNSRLCEQLLLKSLKICVVDYKGEYATLDQLKGARIEVIAITGRNGKDDAMAFIEGVNSYVLNLETVVDTIYIPYLLDFFTELWELRRQEKLDADTEGKMIVPIKIFVDEAQHYMPRIGSKAMPKDLTILTRNLKGIFRNIAQQGVGLGLPMHILTQRPTYLDPFIRNQCEVLLLYRQKWENDIEVYMQVIPANGGGRERQEMRRQSIASLPTGCAVYVMPDGKTQDVMLKYKQTPDLSRTPGWAQQVEAMEAKRHEWDKTAGNTDIGEEA